MIEILLTLAFIFGCFIGSFLGVAVDRMYRDEQFIRGNSYCEFCKKKLSFLKDMIPVLSYLLLQGKCRYCKKDLPKSLPIIELVTGFLFAVIFYISFVGYNDVLNFSFANILNFAYLIILFCLIEIIFFMDAKYMAIPMTPLILIVAIFILKLIIGNELLVNLDYRIYGALTMLVFFGGIHFFTKGQMMGDGDIYLASILGFILALDLSVLMWFLAFVIGALYGAFLMIFRKAGLKQQVPFGPFLIIGFILSYAIGSLFLGFYYSFFSA